jgi:SAM-dependent methyltransferase
MSIISKIKDGIRKFGVSGSVVNLFEQKLNIRLPLPDKLRWKWNIRSEVYFWDTYLGSKGSQWPEDYRQRMSTDLPLQPEFFSLLPKDHKDVRLLDVGAGPLTYIGKLYPGYNLKIEATDPLAPDYDRLLNKYGLKPPVHTVPGDAEKLTQYFPENTFDIVHARNCIDHTYSPEHAVLEMVRVTKPGCYVLMQHAPNEAISQKWAGLHNWNFSEENGDFIISSKTMKLNFTQKYKDICTTRTYLNDAKDWLYTEIRKPD